VNGLFLQGPVEALDDTVGLWLGSPTDIRTRAAELAQQSLCGVE
jgi:hypothetical protein